MVPIVTAINRNQFRGQGTCTVTPKPMQKSSKNKRDATLNIDDIFKPGIGIDIVFDMNADFPVVRSSMIHDCHYNTSQMIISQPNPPILPSFKYTTMSVTAIVKKELNETFRYGMNAKITRFLPNYVLSDRTRDNAILVHYDAPGDKVNIRSAYRLEPGLGYKVSGTVVFKENAFPSEKFFKVKDISFTGLSITVPVNKGGKANPLVSAKVGEAASIELQLVSPDKSSPGVSISSDVIIVRKKMTATKKMAFLGMKFTPLPERHETLLSKFIHEAQITRIKRGSLY